MGESVYDQVETLVRSPKVELAAAEFAQLAIDKGFGESDLASIAALFEYLSAERKHKVLETMLRLSRLPQKNPKTFENFGFDYVHDRHTETIRQLPSLSAAYAHNNIALIGLEGVGKTHLAQAYGYKRCNRGLKTYFLKATEPNGRFMKAIREEREGKVVDFLARPSCLIIDEIGRCTFNAPCTNMFFDLIDRRYQKEGPNTIIFTSNYGVERWGEFFSEPSAILCSLDRIFDDATVFMMKGKSYRGRKLQTYAVETGESTPTLP